MWRFGMIIKVMFECSRERRFSLHFSMRLGRIRPTVLVSAWIWSGVPQHWSFPPVSGGRPPDFYPLWGAGLIALSLRRPFIRGMPTGPKVFLLMLDACGLRPCDRTHLKNGLVSHLYAGGAYDKYRGVWSLWDAR